MIFSNLHIRTLRFRNKLNGDQLARTQQDEPKLPRVTLRKGHLNTGTLPVSVRTARQYLVFRDRSDSAMDTMHRTVLRSEPPSR